MRKIILFFLFITSLNAQDIQYLLEQEPEMRVQIIYSLKEIDINFNNNWILTDNLKNKTETFNSKDLTKIALGKDCFNITKNNSEIQSKADFLVLQSKNPDASLSINDVPYGIGWWWEGTETRSYEGTIEIRRNNQFLEVIVVLPLEKYLCGVVPYEIGGDAPLEALKAQAVAARSDAVEAYISGKYRGEHYDICTDVECQVFGGNNKRTEKSDRAVKETRSLCLLDGTHVISAYYSSNCGGLSERIENVWPDRSGPRKYWGSYVDAEIDSEHQIKNEEKLRSWINSSPKVYCNPKYDENLPAFSKRNLRWQVEVSNKELSQNLNNIKEIGVLQKIEPIKRGPSGRMIKAAFIGEKDTLILNSELEIRKIKSSPLRSSCFYFEIKGQDDSLTYIFTGAGWGHGVGMCQSGAIGRANAGHDFRQILSHYFRGTMITEVFK